MPELKTRLALICRADLLARVDRARRCLDEADKAEAEAAEMVAKLKAIAKISRPGRARKLLNDATHIRRTIWKDVAAVRTYSFAVLNALQAELDTLTE